ncbi:MAG: hypothetical protein ACRDIU_07705 [Actinomycetota bacterium]
MLVTGTALAQQPGRRSPEACGRVRSLAVADDGAVLYEYGIPGRGRLGILRDGKAVDAGTAVFSELASFGGRIAVNGLGGAVFARGAELVEVSGSGDPETVISGAKPSPAPTSEAGVDHEAQEAASYRGSRGDGGPMRDGRFGVIRALAADEAGLFASEYVGNPYFQSIRVRFLNRSQRPIEFYATTPGALRVQPGTIQTVAGVFGRARQAEHIPARTAVLSGAGAVAAQWPLLYIVTWSALSAGARPGPAVRAVNLGAQPVQAHGQKIEAGNVVTVAGSGASGYSGDGGAALGASFSYLTGIAADGSGNLFVADRDNNRIRKVDASGIVSTVAGSGPAGPGRGGFNGNDIPAASARLDGPVDVKVARDATIYLSDEGNAQVRRIDASGTISLAVSPGASSPKACTPAASAAAPPQRAGLPRAVTVGLGVALITASAGLAVLSFKNPRPPRGMGSARGGGC